MDSWFDYLKASLSRLPAQDRLVGESGYLDARTSLDLLRPYLRAHWRRGLLGVLLILFTSLLALPQPLIYRFFVDQVLLAQRLDLLVWAVLLLAAIKGLGMASGAVQGYLLTRFEQDVLVDIQRDLFAHTLRLPKIFFDGQETGYLMARLSSDVQGLRWFFSGTVAYLASSLLRFIGGAALLFYLNWGLTLATVIALPIMVVTVRYFSERTRILSHHIMEQQASLSRRVQETLSALSLIKAFGSEERETGRILTELDGVRQIALERTALGTLANLAIGAMPDLGRGVVLVVGAYWVIQSEWSLGSLLAFQSYLGYVYGPALMLASFNLQFQGALAALQRVSALYAIVPEEKPGQGQPVEHLRGEIEFKGVGFSYGQGEPVLQDVSFHIPPGERVAIIGPSGVGKTTLVSLILRFYRPMQGEIWFDGQPASTYDLGSLRQRIGYVSQSTLLLSGTILDNLRYGNQEADLAAVTQAAKTAGIHDFITSLEGAYDSLVGEHGVNLSEGQKQRLSIARALVKNPDILVLDEPASGLDRVTEQAVFEALPNMLGGKTLFIVTHRLQAARNADRILLLNNKRLVAIGAHQELLAESAYYRSLLQDQ